MTVKHTPGPWTCTATSHYAHDYRLGIPGGQMPFSRGDGTEYANARLIAAAPDLLQELINITSAKPSTWEDPTEFKAWAQSRAQAAIVKATGE